MSEFKRIVIARRRLITGAAGAGVLAAMGAGRAFAAPSAARPPSATRRSRMARSPSRC